MAGPRPTIHISLEELLEDPSKANSVPLASIPGYISQLGGLITVLSSRLALAPPFEKPKRDKLLNAQQAAKLLGVPVDWIYRYRRKLPSLRVGKHLRFSRRSLERWIQEQESLSA